MCTHPSSSRCVQHPHACLHAPLPAGCTQSQHTPIEHMPAAHLHLAPPPSPCCMFATLCTQVAIRPWDTSTVMPDEHNSARSSLPPALTPAGSSSMLLERWTLCFSPSLNSSSGCGNSRASMDTAAVYKRLVSEGAAGPAPCHGHQPSTGRQHQHASATLLLMAPAQHQHRCVGLYTFPSPPICLAGTPSAPPAHTHEVTHFCTVPAHRSLHLAAHPVQGPAPHALLNYPASPHTCLQSKSVHTQILLIRSLYSYVRVLPAYRMYRACKRHGGELFNTSYTLSTTADPSMQLQPWAQQQQQSAAAPGGSSSSSGGRMCQFAFTPVETLGGAFSIHVEYQPATTVHILEVRQCLALGQAHTLLHEAVLSCGRGASLVPLGRV